MQTTLIYLRDQCGYDYRLIAREPSPMFMRKYRDGSRLGRASAYHRFIVTCRYHWTGEVAEDYIAARANRRVQQLA